MKDGIQWQFTIDRNKLSQIYTLHFPILLFIGDTVEHNKLCGLQGGFSANHLCCLCDVPHDMLDVPSRAVSAYEQLEMKKSGKRFKSNVYTLTDTRVLQDKRVTDPQYVKNQGYYPCQQNILQELQFCDRLGLNTSTPPEVLHAVLLCHGTRSLNAFARLTKQTQSSHSAPAASLVHNVDDDQSNHSDDACESTYKKQYFVFTGKYRDVVENEMKIIGLSWSRQSDPDRPRSHFPSGYLPMPNKHDNNTSGKKAAHELRGVLLPILFFLLLHSQQSELEKRVGMQQVSAYIHLFELIILLESWLTWDQYTEDELCLAEQFMPLFTNTFVATINRTEGCGTKLIKVHLLHHFVDCIRLFGRANNFHGGTGESHLKPIKDHARRTKFQNHDYEYCTMVKHWEAGIIHKGSLEVLSVKPRSVIAKNIAALSLQKDSDNNHGNRCGSRVYFKVMGGVVSSTIAVLAEKWQSLLSITSLINILQQFGNCSGFIHTEYNANLNKYHGNFYQCWEDWCFYQTSNGTNKHLCNLLLFITIESASSNPLSLLHDCQEYMQNKGTYAVVHYTSENVFQSKPKTLLYKVQYSNFLAHEDCYLIWHWAKCTTQQSTHLVKELVGQDICPKIAFINVKDIICPVIGVADVTNPIPHSYLFMPRRALFPQFFVERMQQLVKESRKRKKD